MQSIFFKILKILITLALVLVVISFAIALIFGFPINQTLRIMFGVTYVLFVPGFVWSYVFFKKQAGANIRKDVNEVQSNKIRIESPIDLIERITLSFALSMAMGPLLIFFLNKIGVKINFINSFFEIFGLIVAGFVILILQEHRKNNFCQKLNKPDSPAASIRAGFL